jgi:hypothetical protein
MTLKSTSANKIRRKNQWMYNTWQIRRLCTKYLLVNNTTQRQRYCRTPTFFQPISLPKYSCLGKYSCHSKTANTDWGVFRWPWLLLLLWKVDRRLFVTINRCIPVKNTLGWSAVLFCACEIIQLFSVVFCVITAVTLILLKTKHPTNGNQWK